MEPTARQRLTEVGADADLTLEILEAINQGTLVVPKVDVAGFPGIDGKTVWDWREPLAATLPKHSVETAFQTYFPHLKIADFARLSGETWTFEIEALERLGLSLSRFAAFGVLNGGMATSYVDLKKNRGLSSGLFEIFSSDWERLTQAYEGRPKGVTPAFVQPDGSPGPSFLELKLRHLVRINRASAQAGLPGPGMLLFQMTSPATSSLLQESFANYRQSPLLTDWSQFYPGDLGQPPSREQPLVGSFTPVSQGLPRQLFMATGPNGPQPYALPGGHGQNFRVLEDLYRQLRHQGYRFVWIGNVDNLGNLPSLKSLALLALSGAPAGFDFSFKTPIDVKGGVLYRERSGHLNCADLGAGLDKNLVAEAERSGHPVLFNCATGLFDLDQLLANLGRIRNELPVRLSEQDKDVGRYAQAELNTWEVIGLFDHPLILGVHKQKRFLAAKLLIDSLLTSAVHLDHPWFATDEGQPWSEVSSNLHQGLVDLLKGPYGMRLEAGRWVSDDANTKGIFV